MRQGAHRDLSSFHCSLANRSLPGMLAVVYLWTSVGGTFGVSKWAEKKVSMSCFSLRQGSLLQWRREEVRERDKTVLDGDKRSRSAQQGHRNVWWSRTWMNGGDSRVSIGHWYQWGSGDWEHFSSLSHFVRFRCYRREESVQWSALDGDRPKSG